jgi:FkbM family methyltransferase
LGSPLRTKVRRTIARFGWDVHRVPPPGIVGTWIDVGAHHGETTFHHALANPQLKVFALEPNLRAAVRMIGRAPNFIVIPIAIAETNGCANFFLNDLEQASSLLPLNDDGVRCWGVAEVLKVNDVIVVPTIRLDTLMELMCIDKVDFLKVDAQGMDLAVLKSAGLRLRDISKITLEVAVTPQSVYSGAPRKPEIIGYLNQHGFTLSATETQSDGHEENLSFVRKDSFEAREISVDAR